MRRLEEEIRDIRIPPESLARWALETPLVLREATYAALTFLLSVEHASVNLLPVPAVLASTAAVQDPDGFLRQPRGAVELFRLRAHRAIAWMDALIFFRERFPDASRRQPEPSLLAMAQLFSRRSDPLDAACDLLVRESVMPELEEILHRAVKYPALQLVLERVRENDAQRSAEARRHAADILGELSGARLWNVRRRLVFTAGRAVLAAKPLLDELERGGIQVDRTRAVRGFARRLEESIAELPGAPVLQSILHQLAGQRPGLLDDDDEAQPSAE